jgi:predicted HTH domain antitoxin
MSSVEQTVLEIPLPPFIQEEEARLMLAVKLFELGRLSLGQGAQMAAMTKRSFVDALSRLGAPIANYPASDLIEEIAWQE